MAPTSDCSTPPSHETLEITILLYFLRTALAPGQSLHVHAGHTQGIGKVMNNQPVVFVFDVSRTTDNWDVTKQCNSQCLEVSERFWRLSKSLNLFSMYAQHRGEVLRASQEKLPGTLPKTSQELSGTLQELLRSSQELPGAPQELPMGSSGAPQELP